MPTPAYTSCPYCNYKWAPRPGTPRKCPHPKCGKPIRLTAKEKKERQYPRKFISREEILLQTRRKRTIPPLSPELLAFGEEVRRTRIRKLLTQPQLAEKFNTSVRILGNIETGIGKPRDPLLMERLRIWVETNKPLNQRPKADNVDEMFKHLQGE